MMGGVNLSWIEVPKFNGTTLNWRLFWEKFQTTVLDKPHLGEIDKLTYLWNALKGGSAMYIIQSLTQMAEGYEEAIKCRKELYNCPKVPHYEHDRSIIQASIMKGKNGRELLKLYDTCKHHIRVVELSYHFNLEMFLTIAMELKMNEVKKLKWMVYSNDYQTMPSYSELL